MEFQRNSSGIPMESHGFHRESFPEAPGFRPFPLEFLGKKWEFPWKWNPKWLRLQPNAFHRNSMEFRGIPTFHWESGGICRNSWRRVKTLQAHGCSHTSIDALPTFFLSFSFLSLLSLQFGTNLLLDPFWNIPSKSPTYKPAFLQHSTLLAADPPSHTFYINNCTRYSVVSMQPRFDTTIGLLDVPCSDEVVLDHIESFLNKFSSSFTSTL